MMPKRFQFSIRTLLILMVIMACCYPLWQLTDTFGRHDVYWRTGRYPQSASDWNDKHKYPDGSVDSMTKAVAPLVVRMYDTSGRYPDAHYYYFWCFGFSCELPWVVHSPYDRPKFRMTLPGWLG